MRFEKCYRLWGADLSADWSPLQAGLERFVALDKGDFIGRDALAARARAGLHARALLPRGRCRRSRCSRAASPSTPVGERPVAYVSSGGYGHTIERSIALAYLPVEHAPVGTELTIGILGERRRAVVCEQPLLDPAGERLLS